MCGRPAATAARRSFQLPNRNVRPGCHPRRAPQSSVHRLSHRRRCRPHRSIHGVRHRRSFAALLPSHPRGEALHPAAVVSGPGPPSPRQVVILSAAASAVSIHPPPVRRPGPSIPGRGRGGNRRPAASRPSRRQRLPYPRAYAPQAYVQPSSFRPTSSSVPAFRRRTGSPSSRPGRRWSPSIRRRYAAPVLPSPAVVAAGTVVRRRPVHPGRLPTRRARSSFFPRYGLLRVRNPIT